MSDANDRILHDLYFEWVEHWQEVPVEDGEYKEICTRNEAIMLALQNSLTEVQKPLFMQLDGITGQRLAWVAENRFVNGLKLGARMLCAILEL